MNNNDFTFDDKFHLQILGTAMGKKYAPGLANLYLLDLDHVAMNDFKIKPILYFRYLDDIFFIWPGDIITLTEYENFLNSLIPNIKITLEHHREHINFLDTTIFKDLEGDLTTLKAKVFFKPTDTHQLLQKFSHHPRHTFNGIIKLQLIRFKRISSRKEDYMNTCKILFSHLKQRGYTWSDLKHKADEIWYKYVEKPGPNEVGINLEKGSVHKSETQNCNLVIPFFQGGNELAQIYKHSLRENNYFGSLR